MNRKTFLSLVACFCVCVVLGWSLLSVSFSQGWIHLSPEDRHAGAILLPLAVFLGLLVLFTLIGIGLYVYRDARRRGMEPLLWTLVAIFVPYFIGVIIYLVARQPLLTACPSCAASVPLKASFCSSCGRPLQRICARCQTSVQNGARFCHACGAAVVQG